MPQTSPNLHAINYHANKNKAVETLIGILHGITADEFLKPIELQFLNLWLTENSFLKNDPDAIDILDCLSSINYRAQITKDEMEDLLSLLQTILTHRTIDNGRSESVSSLNTLGGIIQGILSDSHLNDNEIHSLRAWLAQSKLNVWPASAIKIRIEEILKDEIITENERNGLIDLLTQCGATKFAETGTTEVTTISLGTCDIEELTFNENTFCFTGTFFTGNRNSCEKIVIDRGGKVSSSISKKVNFLILGTFPTRDWINTSHGLKIQKAIDIQSQGGNLKLITEQTWSKFL